MPSFQQRVRPNSTGQESPGLVRPTSGGGRGNAYMQDRLRQQQAGQGQGLGTQQSTPTQVGADGIPVQYASKSAVWKMGYRDGVSQAQGGLANIARDAQTQAALGNASKATGVSLDNLTAMSIIESTGNRNVGTNAYGYTGLMQMGRDAASDVGMSYRGLQGGGNVGNNALAGAKYWKVNEQRLDEDIPRDPLHMYLAHQQGAGGTNQLMDTLQSNPGKAAPGAQKNNLPEAVVKAKGGRVSQQDFYDYWAGKMQAIQDAIAASKQKA